MAIAYSQAAGQWGKANPSAVGNFRDLQNYLPPYATNVGILQSVTSNANGQSLVTLNIKRPAIPAVVNAVQRAENPTGSTTSAIMPYAVTQQVSDASTGGVTTEISKVVIPFSAKDAMPSGSIKVPFGVPLP